MKELETSELDGGKFRLYRLARFDLVCLWHNSFVILLVVRLFANC